MSSVKRKSSKPNPDLKLSKIDLERKSIYNQGRHHKNWGFAPFYKTHKYYSDYMDGYHGRYFDLHKYNKGKRNFFERLSIAFSVLFN